MSAPSAATPVLPLVGATLMGKYRLDSAIGEGGMGAVFHATHLGLGQAVAIKIMAPQVMHQQMMVERFWREARALAKIKSPHICQVFDVDRTPEGIPFIVLELLEGSTLDAEVRAHPAHTLSERVQWIVDACEGLSAAHEAGVVHRDIKPANLMLVQAGSRSVVKLLDFGVAKSRDDAGQELTGTDEAVGTLKYMAPEQLLSSRTVDARADIWAMAVTLHRLLSGDMPFEGTSARDYLQAVLHKAPVALRTVCPAAPEGLETALLWALTREPDKRPQTVRAWADSLRPFGVTREREVPAREPTFDVQVSMIVEPETGSTRREVAVAAAAVCALLVVALAVVLLRGNGGSQPTPTPTPPVAPTPAPEALLRPAPTAPEIKTTPPPPDTAAVPVAPGPAVAVPQPSVKPPGPPADDSSAAARPTTPAPAAGLPPKKVPVHRPTAATTEQPKPKVTPEGNPTHL